MQVGVSLPKDLVAELREEARERKVSFSAVCREYMEDGYYEEEDDSDSH